MKCGAMPPKGVKIACRWRDIRTGVGCPNYAETKDGLCSTHKPTYAERKAAGQRTGSTWEWRKKRQQVWIRQHGRCAECDIPLAAPGADGPGVAWELHHVDGNPKNDDLSNLVALSRECHVKTFKRRP